MEEVFIFFASCFNEGEEEDISRSGAQVFSKARVEVSCEANFYVFRLVFISDEIDSGGSYGLKGVSFFVESFLFRKASA